MSLLLQICRLCRSVLSLQPDYVDWISDTIFPFFFAIGKQTASLHRIASLLLSRLLWRCYSSSLPMSAFFFFIKLNCLDPLSLTHSAGIVFVFVNTYRYRCHRLELGTLPVCFFCDFVYFLLIYLFCQAHIETFMTAFVTNPPTGRSFRRTIVKMMTVRFFGCV